MISPPPRLLRIACAWCSSLVLGGGLASGQPDQVVARGVQFLKSSMVGGGQAGETALSTLALIKAEVPASDPALAKGLAVIERRFAESGYQPERMGGPETYEAAVIIMALANLDAATYKPQIDSAARYIAARQNPNGSWDYQSRSFGDTSISQYAVLGLWEAENAGVAISPAIWDRAAQWFLSVQSSAGGWTYHRDSGGAETIAMTAAGVGSLLICDRQLAPYRTAVKVSNPLLIPLEFEGQRKRYVPDVSPKRIHQAAQAGIDWLGSNFTTSSPAIIGHSAYYALYGIERIGALADQSTLGRRDWFLEGQKFIASSQRPDGGFAGGYGDGPNTAWAILFLTKSTAKTIRKIQLRRLGAGTLVGGRGLPKDLSQISVAGGRVVARPMDGAVEGMLAVLEDPRVEDAASALAGLISRYRTEGSRAIRPFQDRFRKLLTDPDPGVRRVAAWSLARTGDLAMALPLIEALKDPDDGVVAEARQGLELLSRKIEGYGPPPSASQAERERAMARWRGWYESVRPAAVSQGGPSGTNSTANPSSRRLP